MELLKFFIKDDVPAVGLKNFKDKKEDEQADALQIPQRLNLNRRALGMSYNRSMYIM